jgi:hypothetical protein
LNREHSTSLITHDYQHGATQSPIEWIDKRPQIDDISQLKRTIIFYIVTLRIHAISLVKSHDLLEDRRTELRHKFLKCRK